MPIGIAVNYKGVTNEEVLNIISEIYPDYEEVIRSKSGGPASYIKVKRWKRKDWFYKCYE